MPPPSPKSSKLYGQFRLRSGVAMATRGNFDKEYRFEANPDLLRAIAGQLVPLIPPGIDALAGLELGGVPIATALLTSSDGITRRVRSKARQGIRDLPGWPKEGKSGGEDCLSSRTSSLREGRSSSHARSCAPSELPSAMRCASSTARRVGPRRCARRTSNSAHCS